MKTCPDCGERVYNLGCVNCNKDAYIAEQEMLTELLWPDKPSAANGPERTDEQRGDDEYFRSGTRWPGQ